MLPRWRHFQLRLALAHLRSAGTCRLCRGQRMPRALFHSQYRALSFVAMRSRILPVLALVGLCDLRGHLRQLTSRYPPNWPRSACSDLTGPGLLTQGLAYRINEMLASLSRLRIEYTTNRPQHRFCYFDTYFLFAPWPMLAPEADAAPGIFADSLYTFLKAAPAPS